MHYLIDGYNLLFRLLESKKSLQSGRETIIHSLQKEFQYLHLKGTIVFDGRHRLDEESGLSYRSPLVIAYSHDGTTADQYILGEIEGARIPSEITVVSDDRFLTSAARTLGAKTLYLLAFISFLEKKHALKKQKKQDLREERPFKESKKETERLLKAFEEKLKQES